MSLSIAGPLRDAEVVRLDVAVRDPHRLEIHDGLEKVGSPPLEHVEVRPAGLAQHCPKGRRTGIGEEQTDAIPDLPCSISLSTSSRRERTSVMPTGRALTSPRDALWTSSSSDSGTPSMTEVRLSPFCTRSRSSWWVAAGGLLVRRRYETVPNANTSTELSASSGS